MIKIAIMQPYFFPYIGYWQLINSVDKFIIYDDVNYIKRGWINRNNILLGEKKYLITLPLQDASQWKLINEISVMLDEKIRKILLKTISHAYKKAPFFSSVFPIIEEVINKDGVIAEMLRDSIELVCRYCEIETEIIMSSNIDKNNILKGQDKLIEICKKLHATDYVNSIGGKELYDKQEFKKNDINLHFIETKDVSYNQFSNEFVPNLSIIDVMMFNSKDQLKKMLNSYNLI